MHRLNILKYWGYLVGLTISSTALAEQSYFPKSGEMIAAAIDNSRLTQAAAMLARLKADPAHDTPETELLEGELALALKNNDLALEIFRNYLDHPKFGCRSQEGAGIALVRLGNMRAATEQLAAVTLRCPDRWKSWNMMGVILSHFKKWDAGEHAFTRAIALSDHAPAVLNNYGYSLMAQKKFSDAQSYLVAALDQQPDNVRFQNNLDIARAALGEAPVKLKGQSKQRWNERLNNSGHAARLTGHERIGVALLSEAVIGSTAMASVAAANLSSTRADTTLP